MQALIEVRRKHEQTTDQGRERTHLLALYGNLCKCTPTRDARVSHLLQDVLLAAGSELQLC